MFLGECLQFVIASRLQSGQTIIVDAGESERVDEHSAVRIDSLFLSSKVEAGKSKAVDSINLLRREMALDPMEIPFCP